MRNLLLAVMRIKDDFVNQKLMMTLYTVGSVICILVFMYFFANVPTLIQQYIALLNTPYNRTYSFLLKEETEITLSDFDFLKDYDIENIGLVFNPHDTGTYLAVTSAEYLTRGGLTQEQADAIFADGNYILQIQNNNTPFYHNKAPLPETLTFNGTEFKVIDDIAEVKYTNMWYTGLMSLDSFVKNHFKTSDIYIVLKSSLSPRDSSELIALLSKGFEDKGISAISDPLTDDPTERQRGELLGKILNITLLYIICFIACAYLFKYVFDSNRYENTIYSLIGASKRRVVIIMLIDAAVLSAASFAIAAVINLLFFGTEVYNIFDYLTIAVFTLILSILTIIPFFVVYIKNPLIKTKNECV